MTFGNCFSPFNRRQVFDFRHAEVRTLPPQPNDFNNLRRIRPADRAGDTIEGFRKMIAAARQRRELSLSSAPRTICHVNGSRKGAFAFFSAQNHAKAPQGYPQISALARQSASRRSMVN